MDPLLVWAGNTEVVETLLGFLSAREVAGLGAVSRGWRAATNQSHLWARLCRRAGWGGAGPGEEEGGAGDTALEPAVCLGTAVPAVCGGAGRRQCSARCRRRGGRAGSPAGLQRGPGDARHHGRLAGGGLSRLLPSPSWTSR